MDFELEAFDGCSEATNRGGNPFGDTWRPAESDMPDRDARRAFQGGWFWRAGEEQFIFPAETLYERYLKSAGRNTNLLIGMNIDSDGRFPEADSREFEKLGKMIGENFGKVKAEYKGGMSGTEYRLETPDGSDAKYLVVCEDIAYGERILSYKLDNGFTGHAIGHKRIILLPEKNRGKVTFTVVEAKDTPMLRSIELY